MTDVRGEASAGGAVKASKAGRFFGSLKDALVAASRDDAPAVANGGVPAVIIPPAPQGPSAEEAARLVRAAAARPITAVTVIEPERHIEYETPPTTRVVRATPKAAESVKADRTVLVRGRGAIARQTFAQDPVVGFLIVVGGPGLGSFRPVFEGNNTVGRSSDNRVPLDFGDDTISADAQAYVRYDSSDRSFLFVPNLAKTNVVSVNDKRPTAAVELKAMDVITLGRTQVAFVPFCGGEFDWSEISET